MLIVNNNQLQLLHGKGIKPRSLVYPSALYAHERSFVPVWKALEASYGENSTIFIENLGGRRPPRRVRAYNSTNNHEVNNILKEPHQGMHVVEFEG